MAQDAGEKFRVFVSHKQDDHTLAVTLKRVVESLSGKIECFVSGSDLVPGSDWNAEIRSQLLKSHLLILLFTEPSRNWDWCLYEAGLFTSLSVADDHSVVCLYHPHGSSPRPLTNLQGVPVEAEAVQRFFNDLCKETSRIARDWQLGALASRVPHEMIEKATADIIAAFPAGAAANLTYYPCHRLVLDLGAIDHVSTGIPPEAVVVEGDGATSPFTLTLFNLAPGRRRTWGDMVAAAEGAGASWLTDLDQRFVAALNEQLFSPSTSMLQLWDPWRVHRRSYRPVLYQIVREGKPRLGADAPPAHDGRPLQVTILLDPVAGTLEGP
jgi:hypothetical protein